MTLVIIGFISDYSHRTKVKRTTQTSGQAGESRGGVLRSEIEKKEMELVTSARLTFGYC